MDERNQREVQEVRAIDHPSSPEQELTTSNDLQSSRASSSPRFTARTNSSARSRLSSAPPEGISPSPTAIATVTTATNLRHLATFLLGQLVAIVRPALFTLWCSPFLTLPLSADGCELCEDPTHGLEECPRKLPLLLEGIPPLISETDCSSNSLFGLEQHLQQ